jgi:dolichyl-phosphate beta-glucosyltransferase
VVQVEARFGFTHRRKAMRDSELDLSIVIPALNEEIRIKPTLDSILSYLKTRSLHFEIIVVDDGSHDHTLKVCAEKLKSYRHQLVSNGTNYGKGYSVKKGVAAAEGQTILFTDADLSTPIEELDKMLDMIDRGCDVVIGSRAVPMSNVLVRQNPLRELMGKTFNKIAHALAFRDIQDSQCGFKLFKAKPAKDLFKRQKLRGFCFDAEILFLAQKRGYRVKEVGVRWLNSPESKVRIVSDSLQMLWDLARIRWLHRNEDAQG